MAEPPQPTAILRGHKAAVHAAAFVRLDNSGPQGATVATPDTRLATGDGDGFVVLWDLAIVRPRAVWRAHEKSILGLAGWDNAGQIATHGRDHKLIVWQLGVDDEARLSTALPLETGEDDRPRPWMVYMLEVGTVNFCSFAWCTAAAIPVAESTGSAPIERLVATTNALSLEAVDIFHLPTQCRVNTVQLGVNEGMVMAIALFYRNPSDQDDTEPGPLVLVAAFENGVAVVATLDRGVDGPATIRYRAKTHTQPILSLDVAPDQSYFLTSAADGAIAKHPTPMGASAKQTRVENDQKDAEKDASTSTPRPAPSPNPKSLLSVALSEEAAASPQQPSQPRPRPAPSPPEPPVVQTEPLQKTNTKHAGQQGLRIRSDGRIFATGGWDGRVRVYSTKTLREVAVLKWHQTGCFAVAFAPVVGKAASSGHAVGAVGSSSGTEASIMDVGSSASNDTRLTTRTASTALSVKARRLQHAVVAHWVAAGSKDGKVSLWDIF